MEKILNQSTNKEAMVILDGTLCRMLTISPKPLIVGEFFKIKVGVFAMGQR